MIASALRDFRLNAAWSNAVAQFSNLDSPLTTSHRSRSSSTICILNFHVWKLVLRVAGFWYCVPVTGQPKPVQSEPTLITPPRITPLLIMPPVGTRL
ncbi:unnamed protein product [Phytophthora lilii]|uniref:Unnamed protein product n=1 Tax=Phytophthora lilii TaxID=2077276 RepID=A0A9W6YGA7_9STRA|nr:unnamed protein product [Phytophthora lilii]